MGKFLKICLGIGVICVLLGGVASAAGIHVEDLKGLKNQILNRKWNLNLGKNLDIDPFYELDAQQYFDKEEYVHSNEEIIKEAYEAASMGKIHVKGAGITVKFLPYDGSEPGLTTGDDIVVRATKSGKYQSFMRENTLYIIASGKSTKEIAEGLVEIMVPQKVYDTNQLNVIVEAGAAVIDFGEMQAMEVNLELSAGTIEWSALTAQKLGINMTAGTVKGERTAISNSTDVDVKAGVMTLGGVLGAEVNISVSAGKTTLDLSHAMEVYNFDLSCAGGSIKLGEISLEGLAKEQEIDNRAAYNMNVECSAGAVEIKFENESRTR